MPRATTIATEIDLLRTLADTIDLHGVVPMIYVLTDTILKVRLGYGQMEYNNAWLPPPLF